MSIWSLKDRFRFQILETPAEMKLVEDLQRLVWPGDETSVVPGHMLLAAAHNGGLCIGTFVQSEGSDPVLFTDALLVGFVFGFPGLVNASQGPKNIHCSHMLGVHPDFRDQGIGFALKRAQWQMVRRQGIDRIKTACSDCYRRKCCDLSQVHGL